MQPTPSVENELPHKFTELRELARQIKILTEELEQQREDLTTRGSNVVVNLRLLGASLTKAKAMLSRADWEQWLATHAPNTSSRLAAHCLRVVSHGNDEDFWNECRVLVSPERKPKPQAAKPWPRNKNLTTLKRFDTWLHDLNSAPLSGCPKSIVRQYQERLAPIAKALWPDITTR